VNTRIARKSERMSQIRFGKPRVRWFKRDGCLSAEERISEGGMPGVGGAMNAEFFADRLCSKDEGSDFCGGQRRTGGMPGDEEADEEDMVAVVVVVVVG
jgi:hypothetical protein